MLVFFYTRSLLSVLKLVFFFCCWINDKNFNSTKSVKVAREHLHTIGLCEVRIRNERKVRKFIETKPRFFLLKFILTSYKGFEKEEISSVHKVNFDMVYTGKIYFICCLFTCCCWNIFSSLYFFFLIKYLMMISQIRFCTNNI